jgi:hypothetical protein
VRDFTGPVQPSPFGRRDLPPPDSVQTLPPNEEFAGP